MYKNKKIGVLGLGIEGKDSINHLLSLGADVTLLDKKPESEIDFSGVDKEKINIITGDNYLDHLDDFDLLVRSPGVYRNLPEIVTAEKKGVIITSAIKIFFDNCPAKIIGVTGTKGKGTTSTLIYEILKNAGRDVYLSGNIGKPYLELLPKLSNDSFVVMEMSSFQLIDLDISPFISVVLNITNDHMDWHKDRSEYVTAKSQIVRHQSENDFAVINEEYDSSRKFALETKGKVTFFSKAKLEDKYKKDLFLRGEHNLENIAAAVSVAKILNIKEEVVLNTVKNFNGLEHRLEFVKEVRGIKFYNDSFATGPQPTIAATNSFTEEETLILGGSDKGLDYSELLRVIKENKNVINIILIGDVGQKLLTTLKGTTFKGKQIFNMKYSNMVEIVEKAYGITKKGGVVILSPAAASFDMFKNYKDRGQQFKNAVNSLKLR